MQLWERVESGLGDIIQFVESWNVPQRNSCNMVVTLDISARPDDIHHVTGHQLHVVVHTHLNGEPVYVP
jgi:hypothetical protein